MRNRRRAYRGNADTIVQRRNAPAAEQQSQFAVAYITGWVSNRPGCCELFKAIVMPWMEPLTDPDDLRRCVRDLIALSAAWQNRDTRQIDDSVIGPLSSRLDAHVVFIAPPGNGNQLVIELVRLSSKLEPPGPDGSAVFRLTLPAGAADAA